MKNLIFLFVLLISVSSTAFAQTNNYDNIYSASEKAGEIVQVKGEIYSTYYANKSEGKPTFVNLDVYYKNSPITIVIPRGKALEFDLFNLKKGVTVIISGEVVHNEGYKPTIFLTEGKQLQIIDESVSMK